MTSGLLTKVVSGCIRSVTYLLLNWFYIFNHVALETNLKNDFIAQTFHGGRGGSHWLQRNEEITGKCFEALLLIFCLPLKKLL